MNDESVLIKNVLKKYGDIKEEIKNLKTYSSFRVSSRQFIEHFSLFIKQCYHIV